MEILYALVLVLFPFAAPAQTPGASMIAPYHLDQYVEEVTEQRTMPAQIIATEPTIEKLGEATLEAYDVVITGPNGVEDVPVGAIPPSDESSTVKYPTGSDGKLTMDETIEQSVTPQIIATEPTIVKLGEVILNEADDVVITGPGEEDVPVGAIQPSDENSTVKYSTESDNTLTVDDVIEQSAMPAQIIVTEPTAQALEEAMRNEAVDWAFATNDVHRPGRR